MIENGHPLLGKWRSDASDTTTVTEYGQTTVEFLADGRLSYTIHGNEKDEIAVLNFQVEGNTLITNQPSHPRTERTEFSFTDDGRLVLFFEGVPSFYRRVKSE